MSAGPESVCVVAERPCVNNPVTQGLRSWGSVASDARGRTDTDSDIDGPFTEVVSKKEKKRKNRSPGEEGVEGVESDAGDGRKIRKMNPRGSTAPSYASALNRPPTARPAQPRVAPERSLRITGNSMRQSTLVASERRNVQIEKATFFVSNVGENCTVNDIRGHCAAMRVKVLFCFEVTRTDAIARSFKLAVPATASDVIMSADSWPRRVFVRPWNSQRVEQGGEEDSDSQLGYSVWGGDARGEPSQVGASNERDAQVGGVNGEGMAEVSEQARPSLQSQVGLRDVELSNDSGSGPARPEPSSVHFLKGDSTLGTGAVSTQADELADVASDVGAFIPPTTLQARPDITSRNPAELTIEANSVDMVINDSPAINAASTQLNRPEHSPIRSSLN